ncbi:MAG: DNA double-strand break repair nuclease NurA [Nitrososphaerota archaeon]|nr:DNA double-strand break repair nuclease NurA [Nitrososphaerota archaeon]MDG6923245.1 DNA double-strand break repair nuclease NurA [Nitrososphaerota archaeon]
MSLEAARKAIEFLENHIIDDDFGKPHLKRAGVAVYPLEKKNFNKIYERKSRRTLAFVDGGNQEIIGAPNFSVQLNRVYSSAWKGRERAPWRLPRIEFFSSTYSCFREGKIYFETSAIPSSANSERYLPDPEDLSINSMDRTIMNGRQRAGIERVGSIARKFSEWRMALRALDDLSAGDILVMDGTLQGNVTNEVKYSRALSKAAKEKGIVLTGLSKTSSVFTTSGLSLNGAVSMLAKKEKIEGNWYLPVAVSQSMDHDVYITIAKLNQFGDWVFRFEIQREEYEDIGREGLAEVFSLLCENSTDATFPGYPYGLIDADRFARVSEDEVEYYRALVMSQIRNNGENSKFISHIHARDAHELLNLLVKQ